MSQLVWIDVLRMSATRPGRWSREVWKANVQESGGVCSPGQHCGHVSYCLWFSWLRTTVACSLSVLEAGRQKSDDDRVGCPKETPRENIIHAFAMVSQGFRQSFVLLATWCHFNICSSCKASNPYWGIPIHFNLTITWWDAQRSSFQWFQIHTTTNPGACSSDVPCFGECNSSHKRKWRAKES